MAREIERKFLVKGDAWRAAAQGQLYRQGYISSNPQHSVRVRIVSDRGYLTIKGPTVGTARAEFEYEIPLADAAEMLDTLCQQPLIEKTRYLLQVGDLRWEIDEFAGDNAGLILAEIELTAEEQDIDLPDWIGTEVSFDPRYFNASLAKNPYKYWATDAS